MTWPIWLLVVLAVLLSVDRLLLAAERRGWIYWRRRPPPPGAAGHALLEVQALFEPDKRHVVDEVREADLVGDRDEDDEPLRDAPAGPPHDGSE